MSTDNKTLADAQPGGKVRLVDGMQPCIPAPSAHYPMTGEPLFFEGRMREFAVALSAQPSPGGQGDAITPAMVDAAAGVLARWAGHDDGSRWVHEAHDALTAALAARQPVGEPVIDYEDLLDQAKDLIHCGCSVNGAFEWLLEQLTDGEALASPPSQAVDLGKVRQLIGDLRTLDVKESTKNGNAGFVDLRCYWALLGVAGEVERSMADSQAVVNG